MLKRYIKTPAFQLLLVLLLSSCGGGGGSNSSGSVRDNNSLSKYNKPNKDINKETTTLPEKNSSTSSIPSKKEEEGSILFGKLLPKKLNFESPIIPKGNTSGDNLVVGILDSDFVTNKDKLIEKYGNKLEILDKDNVVYTPHGEIVLDNLLQGITPKVVAGSLSEEYGDTKILRYNLDLYKKIMEEMKKNDTDEDIKLKVFNQSWGSGANATKEKEIYEPQNRKLYRQELLKSFSGLTVGTLQEFLTKGNEALDFYDDAINGENALFIWANGNMDEKDNVLLNAGYQAAAPLIKGSLEKGWITVVGVDGENNNEDYFPKHLAYSGVASNWAISADGNDKKTGGYGSSFAAPKVSNVAVQVGSKFPWMTNNDVRLTLFTTTNMVGVGDGLEENKRYLNSFASNTHGWGVLNKERALKGPGAFWKNILKADYNNLDDEDWSYYFMVTLPKDTKSYFENDIYGDSGLKKFGEGTLVLVGNTYYSGKSIVEEGTLEIYKIHSSGIDVKEMGTLVLHNDSVVGYKKSQFDENFIEYETLTNEGTITLIGKNAYAGKLENKGGKLNIPQGAHLNILTEANIENLSVNFYSNAYSTAKGETSSFLQAQNISGDIKEADINGMRKVVVNKENNSLIATISRDNTLNYLGEISGNSKETAEKIELTLKELDSKYENNKISDEEKEMGASIISMSVPQLKQSTEVVSGEIYASAQALNFMQAQNVNRGISNHLATLKDFYSSDYQWQTWVSWQGAEGKLKESGFASAKTKLNGGQFGIDKKFNDNLIGISFAYSYGTGDFEKYAGKYKSDSVGISLYNKKYFENNSYILGRVGVTSFDTNVNRSLLTKTGTLENGKIEHTDKMLSTYLELGKHYQYFTPYIAYSVDILDRGAFDESNASWGIVAKNKTYINKNIIFGLQSDYTLENNIRLSSHLTHQINVGDRDLSFKGHFTNGTTEHTFKGISQIKDTTWIGVGASKPFRENIILGVSLDMRLEDFHKEDILVGTKLSYRF